MESEKKIQKLAQSFSIYPNAIHLSSSTYLTKFDKDIENRMNKIKTKDLEKIVIKLVSENPGVFPRFNQLLDEGITQIGHNQDENLLHVEPEVQNVPNAEKENTDSNNSLLSHKYNTIKKRYDNLKQELNKLATTESINSISESEISNNIIKNIKSNFLKILQKNEKNIKKEKENFLKKNNDLFNELEKKKKLLNKIQSVIKSKSENEIIKKIEEKNKQIKSFESKISERKFELNKNNEIKEELESKNKKIDMIQSQKDLLEMRFEEIQEKVNILNKIVKDKDENIKKLESEMKVNEGKLKLKINELKKSNSQNSQQDKKSEIQKDKDKEDKILTSENKQKIENLEKNVKDLENLKISLETKIDIFKKKISKSKEEQSKKNEDFEKLTSNLNEIKKELLEEKNNREKESKENEKIIQLLKTQLKNLELSTDNNNNKDQEKKVDKKDQEDLEDLKNQINILNSKIQLFKNKEKKIKEENNNLKKNLEEIKKNSENLNLINKEKEKLNQEISHLSNQLSDLKQKYKSLEQEKIKESSEQQTKKEALKNELKNKIKELQSLKEENKELQSLKDENKELQPLKEENKELQSLKEELENLKNQNTNPKNKSPKIKETETDKILSDLRQEIKKKKNKIGIVNNWFKNLNDQRDENKLPNLENNNNDKLVDLYLNVYNEKLALEEKSEKDYHQIKNANQKVKLLEDQVTELEIEIRGLKDEKSSISKDLITDHKQAEKDHETMQKKINKEKEKNEKIIKNLKSDLKKAEDLLSEQRLDFEGQIESLKKDFEKLNEIQGNNKEIVRLNQEISQRDKKIKMLELRDKSIAEKLQKLLKGTRGSSQIMEHSSEKLVDNVQTKFEDLERMNEELEEVIRKKDQLGPDIEDEKNLKEFVKKKGSKILDILTEEKQEDWLLFYKNTTGENVKWDVKNLKEEIKKLKDENYRLQSNLNESYIKTNEEKSTNMELEEKIKNLYNIIKKIFGKLEDIKKFMDEDIIYMIPNNQQSLRKKMDKCLKIIRRTIILIKKVDIYSNEIIEINSRSGDSISQKLEELSAKKENSRSVSTGRAQNSKSLKKRRSKSNQPESNQKSSSKSQLSTKTKNKRVKNARNKMNDKNKVVVSIDDDKNDQNKKSSSKKTKSIDKRSKNSNTSQRGSNYLGKRRMVTRSMTPAKLNHEEILSTFSKKNQNSTTKKSKISKKLLDYGIGESILYMIENNKELDLSKSEKDLLKTIAVERRSDEKARKIVEKAYYKNRTRGKKLNFDDIKLDKKATKTRKRKKKQ